MRKNLHEESRFRFGLVATATGALSSKIVDRKGYNGVELLFLYGLTASKADKMTLVVKDGDATDALTSVADTYLDGTEALACRPAAVTGNTSGVNINVAKRVGYKGNKRYVQFILTPSGTATMIVGGGVFLYSPEKAATSNP